MTDTIAGYQELAEAARKLLGKRHNVFACATVDAEGVKVASYGAALDSTFEIGSVSKGITGLLYADAIERGIIQPETTLGEVLPLDGTKVATVTLSSLSTHRSGLPTLPKSAQPYRRTWELMRHGTNPYGETLEELLEQARGVEVGRPRPRYSNLGFELLGHAIAAATHMTYADLVRSRVSAPLGLDSFSLPATAADVDSLALAGRSRGGEPREPWTGEALGPAGGIYANIKDMARLATALLDETAPGIAALDPVVPYANGLDIGAAWLRLKRKGFVVTWHNGATGGFRSWFGLNRDAGTAAMILSATAASVDHSGFALLKDLATP